MSSSRATSPEETTAALLPATKFSIMPTGAASRPTRSFNYTSGSGSRAVQTWRNGISRAVGSLRRSNTIVTSNPARLGPISTLIRRVSLGAPIESPTDPSLIPSRAADPIEMPALSVTHGPVTAPDEPRSFLDLSSDESSEDERPYSQQPVVGRANSVRVQRSKLVEIHSGAQSSHEGSMATIGIVADELPLPQLLPMTYKRPMSTHMEDAEELQPVPPTSTTETTNESTKEMGPIHAYKILTADDPSPRLMSRFSTTTASNSLPTNGDGPLQESASQAETAINTAGLRPDAALTFTKGEDDNDLNAALAKESKSQDILPTPSLDKSKLSLYGTATEESTIEAPSTSSVQRLLPSPTDGFGSLFNGFPAGTQSIFSPLSLNPVDVDAARLHRTISAPPLPHQNPNRKVTIRPSDLVITDSRGNHRLFRDEVVSTPYPTRDGNMANAEEALAGTRGNINTKENDRFPSQGRAEVLVLQLATARRTGLKKTLLIEITDTAIFDDQQMFKNVRQMYYHDFLGPMGRFFSARQLNYASYGHDSSFDAEDFIKHLKDPKVGHKRKGWLLWLRQHQAVVSDSPQDRSRNNRAAQFSPSSIPRMPFQRSLPQPPKIVLHFEFSIVAIALAVLACLLLSCLATILWVLCGVSGSLTSLHLAERDRRLEPGDRILPGLVLGIFVLSLSSLGSAMWIGGSYILL